MAALRNAIRARLYLNGDWRDVSSDIRYESGISLRRGYGAEDEFASPSTCQFTLNNRSGDYTERNPMSPWYGYLGRSTPFELACQVAADTASTAGTNGWGTTEAHADGAFGTLPWTVATSGAGAGTADFSKASGKARHVLTSAGSARFSYLATVSMREVDFSITVNVPTSNVTGGALAQGIAFANIMVRGQGALTDYFMLRLVAQTNETLTTDWWAATGGGGPATITGLAQTVSGITLASQDIRVRVQAEARTLRAKIWNASSGEPYDWTDTVTVEDDVASTANIRDAAGWVGVRSSLVSGNTNGPITVSYDNFELHSPEFAGEVPSWPRKRDITGNDRTVSVTASDVTRRLGTGESPLNSALRRYILNPPANAPMPVAYWPLEDGEFAVADEVQNASGASGSLGFAVPDAGVAVGKVRWAAAHGLSGAAQSPVVTGGGSMLGFLNPPSSATEWAVAWSQQQSYADGTFLLFTTDTAHIQLIVTRNPNTLLMEIGWSTDNAAPATVASYTFANKNSVEDWHLFSIDLTATGGDIDLFFHVDGAVVDSHIEAGHTLEGLRRIQLSSTTDAAQDTGFAHVAVWNSSSLPFPSDVYDAFTGHAGERALNRAHRLCGEESVEFDWIGAGPVGTDNNTEPMGPQTPRKLLELLRECAAVDNGLLYSQRTINGLQFRTLSRMYARTSWATLSLSGGHFSPPWGATADDRALRNDITANRQGGGTVRYQLDDGSRMSVSSAAEGGAGRYDSSVTVNVERDPQLLAQAQWRVHLGTADEDRFPALRLELHRDVFRDAAGLALSAKLRDLDIGDQITLTAMQSESTYDDLKELVVGIEKSFDQVRYDMTLVCRPASRYNTGTIGSGWRLTSDTTTTAEALDTTETGVDVTVTGTLWTAADAPFDIAIGGERMTVTNVTGASSPQTFTVTRSVNGVTKSHPTIGTPVRLADPNYLGK